MTTIAFDADPDLSFWPTPPEVADDLVYSSLIPGWGQGEASVDGEVPQVRVLEPSAGDGHLARVVRRHLPYAHLTAVEPAPARAAALRAQAAVADEVVESTLEDYLSTVAVQALIGDWRGFDLAVMNPPFTLADRPEAWAEHVLAIWNDPHLLLPGATLAAVVPHVVLTGKSRLVRQVREILGPDQIRYTDGAIRAVNYGQIRPTEKGAFDPVGAGVSTALMWAYKPF